MAGIGFQLKELFKERSLSNKIKAYGFSAFVSSGPWIAAVITVNIILFLSRFYLQTIEAQALFLGTIVYTFVFSQILTAPFQMIITRYYSDRLFQKDYGSIRSGFIGLNGLIFALASILVSIFYFTRPLPLYYKIMASYFFVLLALIWILMVSISSIKDYKNIANAYVIGGGISILLTVILLNNPINFPEYVYQSNLLLAYIIGLSITYVILMYSFLSVFYFGNENTFDFLKYLSLYPSLFYIGFFYTSGLWIDDILMWGSQIGVGVLKTFYYAPVYDNAVFLAYLTIIPSSIMFLVSIETSLYDSYKKYYNYVNSEGNLKEIEVAKKELEHVVYIKLFHSFQVQALITATLVILSKPIFNFLNLSILIRDIFRITAFGALFNIFILHIILVLLYFEFRKDALKIASIFFITNTIFTFYVSSFDIRYYGLGFTVSSFLTFILGCLVLRRMFKKLTKVTFLSQPLAYVQPRGFFVILSRLIKVYIYNKNLKTKK